MIKLGKKIEFFNVKSSFAFVVLLFLSIIIYIPRPVSALVGAAAGAACSSQISAAAGASIAADQSATLAASAAAGSVSAGLGAISGAAISGGGLSDIAAQNITSAAMQGCLQCCSAGTSLSVAGVVGILSQDAQACFSACLGAVAAKNTALANSNAWRIKTANDIKQVARDAAQQVLAVAFKTSLKSFARQVAHDTAVWVASGGKGQKPLFITEGWGAYVKNAADTALGDFIDGVGTKYGMDLCQPNFQVKLAIKIGLDYTQPRKVRCSFSQIMNNWQSAISNADFALEYRESLRPGANDISFALIMADQRNSYVADAEQNAAKSAEINGLWKDIKNVAGQILTPGTVIADTFRQKQANADIGFATFTNTVADIVEEFLNTLVSQLLKNLQSGLFSGSGGNNNNIGNLTPDLSGLAALFNPNSSPVVSGIAGAKLAYSSLIEGQTKVGSNIDIILKLSTCPDSAKANPGPTDCVMDSLFANAVKDKKYVTDLDASVKKRLFAPKINQKFSLDTTITTRAIMIMRKYRIVPVGWEFAAQIINDSTDLPQAMTLGDVMNCFYGGNASGNKGCIIGDDRFKGLVDPYWVLKAPDTFCRRVGYTGYNAFSKEQSGGIVRSQGCVDEQQCLQEDSSGNCAAYGYCTEERRTWDVGKVCESKFNTCTTFKSRGGQTTNWLKNSLDFENCDANNAGCRSYATNFNYQSKQWNGDMISASDALTNFSRFLDSSEIEATLDSSWRVLEDHTVSGNKRLALGATCNRANCEKITGCVYNEAGKYCAMTGTKCVVPAGGISCYADNCYDSANLIVAQNPGFEAQETGINSGDAKFWTDELSFSDINNRHYRASGAGLSGFGLKAVSANNSADLITTLPNIKLEPGANYKLKFAVRGTISRGSIIVAMVAGDSPYSVPNSLTALGGQSFVTTIGSWTQVEMPVVNTNFTTGTIAIVTPTGSITDVALDSFELYQLKSSCAAAGVKLFSAPQTLDDSGASLKPSNIYFNKNIQTCASTAFGCSQFIRAKADLGNNLLYNGGLEYGLAGWSAQISPKPEINQGAADFAVGDHGGSYLIEVEPNAYYSFGFDASQTGADAGNIAVVINVLNAASTASGEITESNCTAKSGNRVNLAFRPAGQYSERKSCYFKTPSDAHLIKFSFDVSIADIRVDNLKLEKVSYPNFTATAYSVYDPSVNHTADQIAYLKQAPDYFGCYKNEGGAWPTTASELNSIIAKRAPECGNFADVCMQSEVGCELYSPINGDPQIPGIIDGLDLCPAECSGYQIYQQEPTNFIADPSFKQFIADKKAKYCSAAYAGCDEFTNLDQVGQGAEKREYYVEFKACQRPANDDGSYYTWEGSDITGYQLKAYNLKKSAVPDPRNGGKGFAPCTDLAYNTDGSNHCLDAATDGFCAKEDMAGNSDCRELYDTDGNVHYRLLSKTITVSDNCHPYRRTQTQATVAAAQTDCDGSHGWWKTATSECIYMAIPQEGRLCAADVAGCRAYTGNRGNNVRNVISASDFASDSAGDTLWVDGNGNKDGIMISAEATYPGGNSLTTQNNNAIIKHQVALLQNHTYTLSFWAKADESFYPDNIAFVSDGALKDAFSATTLAGDNPISPRVQITTEWKRYDLGPVFVTWEPTDNDYLSFNLPSGAKIYLDNIALKELNNNIYAIENSWFTPVSCDNKLDDADGKKALSAGACQDESTGRCSVGEMLGCTAYKDRASTVWYLRSFNSLCRRAAVGCEALLSTHNSESALPQTFNAGAPAYDDVNIPADNLVYLVNDKKFSCSGNDKGCNAFGLPIVDKWDAIVGYQTVFLKNNPTRYSTDLCQHSQLWCEEFASNNSLEYFKDPHGKTCDYVDVAGKGKGWYKTGTSQPCNIGSYIANGGSPDMSFGTGYEPKSEKVQPLGPYSDVLGNYNDGTNKNDAYAGFAGNCQQTSAGCSEYIDPLPEIYTNYLSPKDNGKASADLTVQGYGLYELSGVTMSGSANCSVFRPFGALSLMYYVTGNEMCKITVSAPAGETINIGAGNKVSKAGVYYALSGSVNASGCNGSVDFKSGCILMNTRNSIDYSRASVAERAVKYLSYDSLQTYDNNNPADALPNAVSPAMPAAGWQADSNAVVKAGANRTCNNWLQCTTYQKTNDSTQDYRFDNQDQCLNFGLCDFRNPDGSCGRYVNADIKNITKDTAVSTPNLTGYTIPNYMPVASMDQFGSSASVPNSNFESTVSGSYTGEPLGWIMNASSSDLNNDGWKAYKYAIEGQAQYLKFDIGYLTVNSVYAVNSEPIDVEKGPYALDMWLNTQDLKPETAAARVFVTSEGINSENNDCDKTTSITIANDAGIKHVIMDGQCWITSDSLALKAGLPWTERTVLIQTKGKDTLKIKLMNFDDESKLADNLNLDAAGTAFNYHNCYDLKTKTLTTGGTAAMAGRPNFDTTCNITGGSLFDNVSLKAALRIINKTGENLNDANLPTTSELIARSCRAYPAQDARSCQYYQDNHFYYGWYGYCLMFDPDNPGQCLQWYPIDQLKGDVVDEYSGGYSDQAPLYYCAEAEKKQMHARATDTASGSGGGAAPWSEDVLGQVTGILLGTSGGSNSDSPTGRVIKYALDNPETINLFRYPVIQRARFDLKVGLFGFNVTAGPHIIVGFAMPSGNLYRNYTNCDPAREDEVLCGPFMSAITGMMQRLQDLTSGAGANPILSGLFGNITAGMLPGGTSDAAEAVRASADFIQNTSVSQDAVWPGYGVLFPIVFPLPLGSISLWIGIPIPLPFSAVESAVMGNPMSAGLSTIINSFLRGFNQLMPAVDGTTAGLKIIEDTDDKYASKFTDPNPGSRGDILGAVWGVKAGGLAGFTYGNIISDINYDVYYCTKVVQVVTGSGQNKAWTNRVSKASQFTFLDSDKITPEGGTIDCNDVSTKFFSSPYCYNSLGANPDLNPANLGFQFEGYNADYKPFGAIVTPSADSQNPYLWSSYVDPKAIGQSRHPLYWEAPLLGLNPPYQARMGQPETPKALSNLFAKSYNAWTWVAEDPANPTSAGSYKPINKLTDSGAYDTYVWNAPTAVCPDAWVSGAYKNNGYVRDMNDRDHYCIIKPEIIVSQMKVNGKSDDMIGDSALDSSHAAKLDFVVRVDRDQLPLTSYSVEWGDGDLNITSVTGVKLRARANPENPFTLYHLYDYQKVFDAAKNCTSFAQSGCALHYCSLNADTGIIECFVKIKVTVTDNWRAEGSGYLPFKIQVK